MVDVVDECEHSTEKVNFCVTNSMLSDSKMFNERYHLPPAKLYIM